MGSIIAYNMRTEKDMKTAKWFVGLIAAAAAAFTALASGTAADTVTPAEDIGFIHAEGRILYDSAGNEFIIKGMAFGNEVFENPTEPPSSHHTDESYKELAELGFNSVRFYLNYGLFESDSSPYLYRRTGFDWLDRNIAAAKKYGIKLVLNMHYPQGGYQSGGSGDALWTNYANRSRLKALWTEIARRYADESAILGYGLVNEPAPVGRSNADEALALWQSFAQETTDSIRKYDNNHLIFIERGNPKPYPGGSIKWDIGADQAFPDIKGEDIVYEFHTYDPFLFTHQQFEWSGTQNEKHNYPENGMGKEQLESYVDTIIKLSEKRNAPVYCGEFGAGRHCFEENRGGEQWVSDMLDIFTENRIGFNYHAFNEYSFGLYYPSSDWRTTLRNDALAGIFAEKLPLLRGRTADERRFEQILIFASAIENRYAAAEP